MRYTDIMELDHWVRRRIRMCHLKQWGGHENGLANLETVVSEVSGDTDGLQQEGITRKRVPGILPKPLRPTAGYQRSTYRIRGLFLFAHCGLQFTIRLRPDDFSEPPRPAQAGCVVVWGGAANYRPLPDSGVAFYMDPDFFNKVSIRLSSFFLYSQI